MLTRTNSEKLYLLNELGGVTIDVHEELFPATIRIREGRVLCRCLTCIAFGESESDDPDVRKMGEQRLGKMMPAGWLATCNDAELRAQLLYDTDAVPDDDDVYRRYPFGCADYQALVVEHEFVPMWGHGAMSRLTTYLRTGQYPRLRY